MKIYDCFLFNGEFEILTLRLKLMHKYIHKFVIIEADQTFSGILKPLLFEQNKERFHRFLHQIDYYPVTSLPDSESAWDKEHYLRDQIRMLTKAEDNDLLIIGDVDEILNMETILKHLPVTSPHLIELPCYYHFYNLQASQKFYLTLITPYSAINNTNVGDRNKYKSFALSTIKQTKGLNGGHFTYIFGYDIEKYIQKVKSFSHQELNNSYYLNDKRIKKCLDYNLDLFERNFSYKRVNLKKHFPALYELIRNNPDHKKYLKTFSSRNFLKKFFDKYYLKLKYRQFRLYGSRMKSKIKTLIFE